MTRNEHLNAEQEKILIAAKEQIDCRSFLVKSKGKDFYVCPLCGSGTGNNGNYTGHLKVYPDNKWYCFACHGYGDSIDLIKIKNNFSTSEALNYAKEHYHLIIGAAAPAKRNANKKKEPADFTAYYEKCRDMLSTPEALEYLRQRGISEETAKACGLGFDPEADPANAPGFSENKKHPCPRIIIPVNKNHYIGRSILPETPDGLKKLNNLNCDIGIFNPESLTDDTGICFIHEGCFDALSTLEIGFPAVAINSTSNVDKLLNAIKDKHKLCTLIISMDADGAGKKASDELVKAFTDAGIKFIVDNVSCGFKDANEALTADKERFIQAVRNAANQAKDLPSWIIESQYNGRITKKINEPLFCDQFKDDFKLVRINNVFYLKGKQVLDEYVLSQIQNIIRPYFIERTGRITKDLFVTLQNACFIEQPEPDENKIYCADDTTLYIDQDGNITANKEDIFTLTRLAVKYDPSAQCPTFIKYLNDLLYAEDIPAVQEYIGYCLIPCTRAQAGLYIHGKGGEGKSILRDAMMCLFGHAAIQEGIHRLSDRFVLANLINRLVCIDDDMRTSLLSDTNVLKQLITNSVDKPIQVERKNQQKFDAFIYARVFAIGNSFIGSKFDHSDGFYRRQLLIDCKPKTRPESADDRFMNEKVCSEIDGIFNWALTGLKRLIRNNYHFTVSKRMRDTLDNVKHEGDNTLSFFEDNTVISVTNDFSDMISSADLFTAYALWCFDNAETPTKRRSFLNKIGERYKDLKGKVDTVLNGNACRVNGYNGIKLSDDMQNRISLLDEKVIDRIRRLP